MPKTKRGKTRSETITNINRYIACGRRNFDGTGGNGHAQAHYDASGFPLSVKLGTIAEGGKVADVYSYPEVSLLFLFFHLFLEGNLYLYIIGQHGGGSLAPKTSRALRSQRRSTDENREVDRRARIGPERCFRILSHLRKRQGSAPVVWTGPYWN